VVSVVLAAAAGPVAWNAILRATRADQFFTDAPIPVFPISWQDTGSGVFAVATLASVLGLGGLRADTGRLRWHARCTGRHQRTACVARLKKKPTGAKLWP
jgi:hypothetical protein